MCQPFFCLLAKIIIILYSTIKIPYYYLVVTK